MKNMKMEERNEDSKEWRILTLITNDELGKLGRSFGYVILLLT